MLVICLVGKVEISIKTTDLKKLRYKLDRPNKALFINNKEWRKIISKDKKSMILILASEKYSKNDYL